MAGSMLDSALNVPISYADKSDPSTLHRTLLISPCHSSAKPVSRWLAFVESSTYIIIDGLNPKLLQALTIQVLNTRIPPET